MRIESVNAHGFGPLVGQTLELASGLTIVTGDNESGKSSWHAATYAGLCGRRRGRGRPSVEEQQFIDAHQPWDGGVWAVSCVLSLDDGRRIELRQDLSGKVDCRATDTALARDVSAEIMVDGSPDASAWLGLTRSSFRASACVGQAEVMGVLEAADGLQQALQRAASTAGASGTAAAAIGLLEACRRSSVGRDTASAVRPLRKAREALDSAESQLAEATQSQEILADITQAGRGPGSEVEVSLSLAREAAAEWQTMAAALRAAELRDARAAPVPLRASGTGVTTRARIGRRSKGALAFGLMTLAAALFVTAIVARSWVLSGVGVVAGLLLGTGVWYNVGRRPAAGFEETRGAPREPWSLGHDPPESGELVELRLQLAERQALAESARKRHQEAALRAGRAEAVSAERASAAPSLAEAEEAVAAARRELDRVLELEQTLTLTIGFLGRAQERVHRAVVPELIGLLRGWLPELTDGRYVDARMDPASLGVEVCGPSREFRRAELLSHGTAEQIYLLLRVALAAQLTAGHDTCPLLLDDVTVHADPVRTRGLLELLHLLSADRQIVLFTHEDGVRRWARERLDIDRDRLVVLDQVEVS